MDTTEQVKRSNPWPVIIIVALVVLLIVTFIMFKQQRKVVSLMQLNAVQAQRIEEFDRLGQEVRRFNQKYGAKYGKITTLENLDSLRSDLKALQQSGRLPSDVDSLINDFVSTAAKIEYLSQKIDQLEESIGSPYVVQSGDTHAKIAEDYLVNKAGLSREEAKKVLMRTALVWELEKGNYVYNLYYDGVFLTTVTQGTAKRSPLLLQRQMREAQRRQMEAELRAQLLGDTTGGAPQAP